MTHIWRMYRTHKASSTAIKLGILQWSKCVDVAGRQFMLHLIEAASHWCCISLMLHLRLLLALSLLKTYQRKKKSSRKTQPRLTESILKMSIDIWMTCTHIARTFIEQERQIDVQIYIQVTMKQHFETIWIHKETYHQHAFQLLNSAFPETRITKVSFILSLFLSFHFSTRWRMLQCTHMSRHSSSLFNTLKRTVSALCHMGWGFSV